MINKIELTTVLYCPQCKEEVTAEQYDAYTEGQCLTREQRRHYKSIVAMWNRPGKKKDVYFCCPFCNRWSRITEIKTYKRDDENYKVIERHNSDKDEYYDNDDLELYSEEDDSEGIGLNVEIEDE